MRRLPRRRGDADGDAALARHADRRARRGRRPRRGRGAVRASRSRGCYSATPYVYDPVPRRDERFQDLYNQGVNAEAFLYDPDFPTAPKTLMMLFKRIREIDVPEMMASIIVETKGKPWGYYRDMTRQLWDEARHAMMGEVGFVALGVDWTRARITHNWSLRLNTECTPIERHAVLYFIEQGLMTKTGKRYEWEVGRRVGRPADGHDPGLRLGRRGPPRRDRPRVVHPPDRQLEGGPRLRRPVLVEDPEQLGRRSATRA